MAFTCEYVKLLLEQKVDVNACTYDGRNALSFAAQGTNLNVPPCVIIRAQDVTIMASVSS